MSDRLIVAIRKFASDIEYIPPWESAGAVWASKVRELLAAADAAEAAPPAPPAGGVEDTLAAARREAFEEAARIVENIVVAGTRPTLLAEAAAALRARAEEGGQP